MTIKQLKIFISEIPDDFEVFIEYDGPDANCKLPMNVILTSEQDETVIFMEK